MLTLKLPERDTPLDILCLGAHSDDIEIGCGGTILRLLNERPANVRWVVFSGTSRRRAEAKRCAQDFLRGAKSKKISVHDFPDGFFPYRGAEIKQYFENLKTEISPDLIFTHYRDDLHQDHRLLCELTWNSFRDHTILEYEIPKYDGDLRSPNCFVELEEKVCAEKISYIVKHFYSQQVKPWFTEETFRAILRLRGVESRAGTGYAEGFYARKVKLEL
jgi:LmbE family N-acetylglucosaminyl deacetylase